MSAKLFIFKNGGIIFYSTDTIAFRTFPPPRYALRRGVPKYDVTYWIMTKSFTCVRFFAKTLQFTTLDENIFLVPNNSFHLRTSSAYLLTSKYHVSMRSFKICFVYLIENKGYIRTNKRHHNGTCKASS